MAQKRPHPSSTASTITTTTTNQSPEIYTSKPIHDRASTFLALYSPSTPYQTLQSDPGIAASEHKIAAWRHPSRQSTLSGPPRFDAGHDDDGEKGAGIKLGKLLDAEGVVGAVVVGRWWGGVMLGPVRFTWIEQCAKEAIEAWKAEQQPLSAKRVKTGSEAVADGRTREELITELKARDENIGVLRELLRTKKDKFEGVSSPAASPAKVQEYGTLPVTRLLALDKARDATVAYILKQLDKVDQQLKEEDDLDAAFEQIAAAEEKKKDEAALQEMLRTELEEDDQAFDEMDRIARELEDEARLKEGDQKPATSEAPQTPKRQK